MEITLTEAQQCEHSITALSVEMGYAEALHARYPREPTSPPTTAQQLSQPSGLNLMRGPQDSRVGGGHD